jgi:hypothetical protein
MSWDARKETPLARREIQDTGSTGDIAAERRQYLYFRFLAHDCGLSIAC